MKRIDVHAHYLPPAYRKAATAAGHARPDGMPGLPEWSPQAALGLMDVNEVETAMLSVSSPGVFFGDHEAATSLARTVNEAGADAVAAYPSRFGLFASLPLPDVDATLTEIEYAFDALNADGVAVMTNYAGHHLGDPQFDAVFAELDRRQAVVFMHPMSPVCFACGERGVLPYPAPMLEFMFESTRTVTHLALTGTLSRYPNIRLIVPHAGAALPLLSDRVGGIVNALGIDPPGSADAFFDLVSGLYFDLAGFPVPKMLPSLLSVASTDRLLYGSDWPFTPPPLVSALATALDGAADLAPFTEAIMSGNAQALFPRLA